MHFNNELNDNSLSFKNSANNSMVHDDNADKKIVRKAVFRRTVDYNSSVGLFIEQRTWKRKYDGRCLIQPDHMYQHLLGPPADYKDNPMNCVCTKHVRTSTNKNKCPIYTMCWTPDGRRLITGASSGEFTLWNGLTFNFETILQAHDTQIRTMKWSNNEEWLVSADESGFVKYWQTNMNDINVFQAHKDSVRGISFAPSDVKFATCSVDSTIRIWDFQTNKEERVLRGHGCDVMSVAWHPTKSLLLSGSKDNQQPVKLWDPKAGEYISTMHVHKSGCTDIKFNKNGNWFLTASKDHTMKLFDLRNLKSELQLFRGHKKDVNRVAWHPYHETLFASGSGDGGLLYWFVGLDMEVGAVENAHDNIIWCLDWHPMGHILATGSNDFSTKFWARNQPGDVLVDNLQEENSDAKPDKRENIDLQFGFIQDSDFDYTQFNSSISTEIVDNIDDSKSRYIPSDEDLENRDFQSREIVNRVIPKQFVDNWTNKKATPVVYMKENIPIPQIQPIQPNQLVIPLAQPAQIVVPQIQPIMPNQLVIPLNPAMNPPMNMPSQFSNVVNPLMNKSNFKEEPTIPMNASQNFRMPNPSMPPMRSNFPPNHHLANHPPNHPLLSSRFALGPNRIPEQPRFHHQNHNNNNRNHVGMQPPAFNQDRRQFRPNRPDFHPQNESNRTNNQRQFQQNNSKRPRYNSTQQNHRN